MAGGTPMAGGRQTLYEGTWGARLTEGHLSEAEGLRCKAAETALRRCPVEPVLAFPCACFSSNVCTPASGYVLLQAARG